MAAPSRAGLPRVAYCRRCGAPRAATATVCPACGRRYGRGSSSAAVAKVAGLLWLVLAAVSAVGLLPAALGGDGVVAWVAASAALELLTGLGLFLFPTWEMLTAATLWGALSVIGALMQLANGRVPSPLAVVLVGGIALAAGLSFVARQRLPRPTDR
ncbi:MAG TPA: zinc ribbon domain-containing protein [Candidatus Limnocylindrales bacterium]